MDADEREVYFYLKAFRKEFISAREICRRAGGKKRFKYDVDWAKPALTRMVESGILETDPSGHYRIKPYEMDVRKRKKWVSPQIQRILQQSGRDFSEIVISEDELDKYYDDL
jgi:hypothetical protein